LSSYYYVHPQTAIICLFIDMVSTYVPFKLLRPTSPTHKSNAPRGTISNRAIVYDAPTQILVSALSSGGFALVYAAFCWTRLPVWLVVNFDGIPTVEPAHQAQYILLVAAFIPIGFATQTFLFTPSIGARPDKADTKRMGFDPATATLGETILFNAWGYSVRERVLIERTLVLAVAIMANSVVEVYGLVLGTTLLGAVAWSSIWTIGAIVSGGLLFWVGSVDEVKN
jgi:hypothetical protein